MVPGTKFLKVVRAGLPKESRGVRGNPSILACCRGMYVFGKGIAMRDMTAPGKDRTNCTMYHSKSLAQTIQGAKTILLIEDDVGENLLLSLRLRNAGYEVISVFDPEKGIEKGKTETPDLIVIDLAHSSMSGFGALKRIRSYPFFYGTPVFLMADENHPNAVEIARNAGLSGYFKKPVSPERIIWAIDKVLH